MQQIQPGFRSHCYTVAQEGTPPAQTGGRLPRPAIDEQRKEHTPLLELLSAQKWTGGSRHHGRPSDRPLQNYRFSRVIRLIKFWRVDNEGLITRN
jgi:hypothetical protein